MKSSMKPGRMLRRILVSVAIAITPALVFGEDIDLFLGVPATAADAPNVLFIIDNTANWSQTGTDGRPAWSSEQDALSDVFLSLEPGLVNVGLLMYTESGGGNSNTDGGYIRAAMRLMDDTTKVLYSNQINSFDINADKGNGGKSAVGFAEAYLYFSGGTPEAGNNKVKTDYLNNPDGVGSYVCGDTGGNKPSPIYCTGKTPDGYVWELPDNALDSKSGNTYSSPVAEGFCGKNYIIFISNGPNQDNTSDTRRAESILTALGGDKSQISITPSGNASNASDEWARFMANSDYEITTFTIDVNKSLTGQGPNWTALLKSIATQSGGDYYAADANVSSISDAVNAALSKILAVNSVFASVALPASANSQSTFLNQVFIGQFRPDGSANPRWLGNLKQYKLGFDTSGGGNVLRLLDATDTPAIDSSGTGFIQECARSFWTPGAADNYWAFLDPSDQRGECLAVPNSSTSNYPDGPVVEKGGQAYVGRGAAAWALATASSRLVRTTAASTCGGGGAACTLGLFADGNTAITAGSLGASNAVKRTEYINWARGADVQDEDDDSNVLEYRPSLHGDVIHSQPIALDYASDPDNPRVVVFYGSNDGMLHAINGNRTIAHNGAALNTGTAAGQEFWAFMPPDYFPEIKRHFENSTVVRFPASGANEGSSGEPKSYGPDGPLTAWDNGATNRHLYLGMRRGGRTIYGFDVTNITSPSLLFRLGCTTDSPDDTGCATGWEDLGETWSPMNVAFVDNGAAGGNTPYLIMGGGYDRCEDHDDLTTSPANHSCTAADNGNVIYVLDATTGAIVRSFPTERAVPGAVTIVPANDASPNIAYAYAADTGGNIYRISGAGGAAIGTTPPSGWVITRIADLGCGDKSDATCSANRKFLFGPDVVRVPNSNKYAVLIGSGEREKPLVDYAAANSVTNYFYNVIDLPTDSTWLTSQRTTCNEDSICHDSLTTVDVNAAALATIGDKGWKIRLRSGEQVVSGALTVADMVNFSTHIPVDPAAVQCDSDLGTATTYNVDYLEGRGVLNNIVGGGLVPTPVAGKVILDDGQRVPFCIGCGGENSAIGGSQVTSGITWSQPKSRVYWKIDK